MIRFNRLSFTYNGAERPALANIDVAIEEGEFVLVTGPSGGGKSTFCRCFNGLIPHFYGGTISGSVDICGMNTLRHTPKELATTVGMVFQDPENQLVATDVEREIAFGLENLGFPMHLIARRIEESLDAIGIASLRFRKHQELSSGEKQKVAIASVLALHPKVLVLDEPTSELDPQSAEEVLRVLEKLNDELGITIVLIEHRLERVMHLVDRMLVLNDGRIEFNGHPRELAGRAQIDGLGIGTPPVVRLIQRLRAGNIEVDGNPLTVKEARLSLQKALPNVIIRTANFNSHFPAAQPIIGIERLWFAYRDKAALRDINLSINAGEFIAIMGRNASGKTTLIKHLDGLLQPSKGRVVVCGLDTRHRSVAELSQLVGYVFQNPNDHLFADTVEEEIAFSLRNAGAEPAMIAERVERMLAQFKLSRYRHMYPRYLSGGEKQRLALASVLVSQPRVIVLDEPTRGMDHNLKRELIACLDEYRHHGHTVVMVTHDVEMVAECADRVVLLSEGQVVADGDKRQVLSKAMLFSPQINRLAQALSKYGVADTTLTVDEMVEQLR